MNSASMLWSRIRSDTWISNCGRYRVSKARGAGDRLVMLVHFYEFLAHRLVCDRGVDDLPAPVRAWCEQHRQGIWGRLVEFEAWIADRYQIDLHAGCAGPLSRRDQVWKYIVERGEQNVPFRGRESGRTLTLGETFADIYQSISPLQDEQAANS